MDPNLMEPFAKTYPIVKGDLLARLIERSDAAFTKDKSFHIILRCVEEMVSADLLHRMIMQMASYLDCLLMRSLQQTRAFPTYRKHPMIRPTWSKVG